ncbi:MAG: cupin domain-containing protein [Nitrospirales bacterium]
MKNPFPKQIRNLPAFEGPFDAFKLSAQGCDVMFASYPAGTEIPLHKHETDNVGLITQGELILTIHGKTKRFAVGDWYHVSANSEHAAQFDSDTAEFKFWFKESLT